MPRSTPEKKKSTKAEAPRRQYNSPIREQQSAETRERIVAAGSELVHSLPGWDWKNLTARAISERAGVSERTVHRYFPTERKLRDAVLQRLVEESGVKLNTVTLENFGTVTVGLLGYLSSFAATASSLPNVDDPSLLSMDQQRCQVLLKAVGEATPDWSHPNRAAAAGLLDLLWSPTPYERLISAWGLDSKQAINSIKWLIDLVEQAIREGRHPRLD